MRDLHSIIRLRNIHLNDLIKLSKSEGFPYVVTDCIKHRLQIYFLSGENPIGPGTQIYGCYAATDDSKKPELVGVMTATYMYVSPHIDSPGGKTVQISGAYVRPDMRHNGIATKLLKAIEEDAGQHFDADYLCCDSSADDVYKKAGFIESSESRLWKKLRG